MLQIIGWLLCVCLIVKGLEIWGRGDSHVPREDTPDQTRLREPAAFAIAIAFLGAIVFAFWLGAQGGAMESVSPEGFAAPMPTEAPTAYRQCLDKATTLQEIEACG